MRAARERGNGRGHDGVVPPSAIWLRVGPNWHAPGVDRPRVCPALHEYLDCVAAVAHAGAGLPLVGSHRRLRRCQPRLCGSARPPSSPRAVSKHRNVTNFFDKHPWTSPDVYVAPNATVIGAVDINLKSAVGYGAVVRGALCLYVYEHRGARRVRPLLTCVRACVCQAT